MTAPGERFVLVTVAIRTVGKRCGDWCDESEACPFLRSNWSTCSLFHADLERGKDDDECYGAPYLRAPGCLALDGPELSVEEAYRHGMGSQDG